MKIQTKKINIYKKGTIPFKIKISWVYYKGKLFLTEGSYLNFKQSFIRGFGDMFYNDTKSFNFLYDEKKGIRTPTKLNKDYTEFKNCFRKPKEWSFERRKKHADMMRERYRRRKTKKERAKRDLDKMIEWL